MGGPGSGPRRGGGRRGGGTVTARGRSRRVRRILHGWKPKGISKDNSYTNRGGKKVKIKWFPAGRA
jgi:hypothetical protein